MILDLELPVGLAARGVPVTLRRAHTLDVEALVALIAEGSIDPEAEGLRPNDDLGVYRAALSRITASESNELIVADQEGLLVGMMQLTLIPGISHHGRTRLMVEAVRVSAQKRSSGIGGTMMSWVISTAPKLGADLVQLTSNKRRADAHRFYERIGFSGSHVGFKYEIQG